MQNKLFGIAAIIFSLSIFIVSIGLLNLTNEYRLSLKKQSDITEKSSYIFDSIATTVFLKLAERDCEISPGNSASIRKELAERSKNGYVFEKLLMAWDFKAKKKEPVVEILENESTESKVNEEDKAAPPLNSIPLLETPAAP